MSTKINNKFSANALTKQDIQEDTIISLLARFVRLHPEKLKQELDKFQFLYPDDIEAPELIKTTVYAMGESKGFTKAILTDIYYMEKTNPSELSADGYFSATSVDSLLGLVQTGVTDTTGIVNTVKGLTGGGKTNTPEGQTAQAQTSKQVQDAYNTQAAIAKPKASSTGLYIGIGAGVLVLVIIIVVVSMGKKADTITAPTPAV